MTSKNSTECSFYVKKKLITDQDKNQVVFLPVVAKVACEGPSPPELTADTSIMYNVQTDRLVRIVTFVVQFTRLKLKSLSTSTGL